MKELYLNAEMDVVKFNAADVITTSSNIDPEWTPGENEGDMDWGALDDQN